MTRQSTFKKKVRLRMQKTNERYAVARQALLGERRSPAASSSGVPKAYPVFPGVHGDTARLTAALDHAGVRSATDDKPLDEATVFAMSGGVGFMYFVFEYKDTPPLLTFTCRSWSMTWPLIERVIANAGLEAEVLETTSEKKARASLDASLDQGAVAHLTVDMASLPWVGADPIWKGQMPRQVNVLSRDGEIYVVDDGAIRELDAATLADARAACRKQKNRLVTFAAKPPQSSADKAKATAAAAVHVMTEAPMKGFANNFGLAGLHKAQALVGGEKDKKSWARVFNTPALAHRALRRTWECIHLDYTPPAAGRSFFAEGIRALAAPIDDDNLVASLEDAAKLADESGKRWEALADRVVEGGGSTVERATALAEEIDELQRIHDDTPEILRLRKERDALADECALTQDKALPLFRAISEDFGAIASIEKKMVDALKRASGV